MDLVGLSAPAQQEVWVSGRLPQSGRRNVRCVLFGVGPLGRPECLRRVESVSSPSGGERLLWSATDMPEPHSHEARSF